MSCCSRFRRWRLMVRLRPWWRWIVNMYSISKALFPELLLTAVAAICFLLGTSRKAAARRAAPVLAIIALLIALISQLRQVFDASGVSDPWQSVQISELTRYI